MQWLGIQITSHRIDEIAKIYQNYIIDVYVQYFCNGLKSDTVM